MTTLKIHLDTLNRNTECFNYYIQEMGNVLGK